MVVFFGDDIAEMRNGLVDEYPLLGNLQLEDCEAICTWSDDYCGNFWLIFKHGASIPTISHECNHAAMHILRQHGVILDPFNQEPLAYLQEYILNGVLRYMDDKKLKVKLYNE